MATPVIHFVVFSEFHFRKPLVLVVRKIRFPNTMGYLFKIKKPSSIQFIFASMNNAKPHLILLPSSIIDITLSDIANQSKP